MAQHGDDEIDPEGRGQAVRREPPIPSPGTAVDVAGRIENPGLPPHHERLTDTDPRAERRATGQVVALFWISAIASIFAIVAYFVWPIDTAEDAVGHIASVRLNTLWVGVAIGLALTAIGLGAVLWGKQLIADEELVDYRHPLRSSEETREKAVEIFEVANEESGFGRRTLIRNSLIGAVALSPLPAIVLFRDLAPAEDPNAVLAHTMWRQGTRLARDPSATPIRAADVTLGSVFHVIPENLYESERYLEEKAKAIVLLMRLPEEKLQVSPGREGWGYHGIVAYSKVCTHVGCPVALYEQQTHHLLCPCHQSQFDITREAEVIFGPAKRPLPQLPITVDDEGYLIAQSDFTEPVGPSYWERLRQPEES